jgi:hypothetical protein
MFQHLKLFKLARANAEYFPSESELYTTLNYCKQKFPFIASFNLEEFKLNCFRVFLRIYEVPKNQSCVISL